jgi:hypothetical protein
MHVTMREAAKRVLHGAAFLKGSDTLAAGGNRDCTAFPVALGALFACG